MDINERLSKMEERLSSVENLTQTGTANDMLFFIFDYDPKYEMLIRDKIKSLINNRTDIVEFDLYELMLQIIDEQGYSEEIKDAETLYDKQIMLSSVIQPLLGLERNDNPFIEKFKQIDDNGSKIILLTGAGKAYPFVRSHTILNNLQSVFKNNPVVLFYPGSYNLNKSMTLKLFDILADNNYYRAFPLVNR